MAGMKDWTPEQRSAHMKRAAATRAANKAKREAEAVEREDVSLDFSKAFEYGSAVEHEETVSPPDPIDPADPYQLFLLSLDEDTKRLLGNAKLREIFAAQAKKAAEEKIAKLEKSAASLALGAARAGQGLVAAETQEQIATKRQNNKPVTIMIQLPPSARGGKISDLGLRIDGKLLYHNTRHDCTYGEAASLREIMYRAMEHELVFRGDGIEERQWLMGLAHGQVGRHIGG